MQRQSAKIVWHSYVNEKPDLTKNVKIRIRIGRGGTTLESETHEDFEFTKDKLDKTHQYIPISEVKFKSGVEGAEITSKDAAVNGNYYISATKSNLKDSEDDNYLIYEFNYPVILSRVEYIPDEKDSYGQMKNGEILGSIDGEKWTSLTTIDDLTYTEKGNSVFNQGCNSDFGLVNKKSFEIPDESRIRVRFVKIVAKGVIKDGKGNNLFSARMFNFFEDTEKVIEEEKTIPTADVRYSKMDPTRNTVEATVFGKSSKDVTVIGKETYTFDSNGTHVFQLKDSEGNTGTAVARVDWIDNKVEEPDVTFSIETPTNGEVEAVLNPVKEDIIVLGDKFTLDGTLLYYHGVDEKGKSTSRVCKDFEEGFSMYRGRDIYIDEDKNIVLTEDGEIIDTVYNEVEDTETGVTEENVLYKHKFISNETYTFGYCDLLGNVGTKEVTVDWIDNTPPKGVVTYDVTGATEDPVTATIEFAKQDENGEIVLDEEGNIVKENVTVTDINVVTEGVDESAIKHETNSNKIIFNKNCEVKVDFKDEAGNVGEVTAKVNWIEKLLNSDEYKVENKKVKKVNPHTLLKNLLEKLTSRLGISFIDGETMLDNDANAETVVKTGMKADVNGCNYTIIVTGDVTGDGELQENDILKVHSHYLDKEKLSDEYEEAGDIDESGDISLTDIAKAHKMLDENN